MQRIVVVLPAPFGPRKPVTLPGSTPNVKSSTATLSPDRFVSPRTSIMETGPLLKPRPSQSCPAADGGRVARGDDYAILLQDEPLAVKRAHAAARTDRRQPARPPFALSRGWSLAMTSALGQR